MSAQETTDTITEEKIDWDQRYKNYLEAHRGDMYVDMRLALLEKGLNLQVPKPLTQEALQKFYDAGIIQKKDLVVGAYYWGSCRNSSLAMWDGKEFIYLRTKFSSTFAETINHLEDDNGYDLFIPIRMLSWQEDECG